MKTLKPLALLLGSILAFSAVAQEVARPRSTVDLTRTDRLTGTPRLDGPLNCPAGQVFSGGSCVVMNTASGATILPGNVPSGTYTNGASFPLMFSFMPQGACYDDRIYVNGREVARVRDDCEWSFTSTQAIVPAGSTVAWGGRTIAVVTAMANGASWSATGIRFAASYGAWAPVPGSPTYDGYRPVYDQNGAYMGNEFSQWMYYSPPCCDGG